MLNSFITRCLRCAKIPKLRSYAGISLEFTIQRIKTFQIQLNTRLFSSDTVFLKAKKGKNPTSHTIYGPWYLGSSTSCPNCFQQFNISHRDFKLNAKYSTWSGRLLFYIDNHHGVGLSFHSILEKLQCISNMQSKRKV